MGTRLFAEMETGVVDVVGLILFMVGWVRERGKHSHC